MVNNWSIFRAVLVCSVMLLAACLPEGTDPDITGADKLSGTSYASNLNRIALQIQQSVMSDPRWFTSVSGTSDLDLALYGIEQPAGMSAEIKFGVCPTGTNSEVDQITWIDGRNEERWFTVKEIGTRINSILTALGKQAGSDQIGLYKGLGRIALMNGETISVPYTCPNIDIPLGAPVIVFTIKHPAKPANVLTRTEYRTQACGPNDEGHPRRGTKVQKRTLTYESTGRITPTGPEDGWETSDMGGCLDDVAVSVENRETLATGSSSDLSSFASLDLTLKDLLVEQLKMDCTKMTVKGTGKNNRNISTCGKAAAPAASSIASGAGVENDDIRQVSCTGTLANPSANFGGVSLPGSQIAWEPRGGFTNLVTLTRKVRTHAMSNGTEKENDRNQWVGGNINCGGIETANLACADIPGVPAGAEILENQPLVLKREVSATAWLNASTLNPKITYASWVVQSGQCTWHRTANDCPVAYDAAHVGGWDPVHAPDAIYAAAPGSAIFTTLLSGGVDYLYTLSTAGDTLSVLPTGFTASVECARDARNSVNVQNRIYDCTGAYTTADISVRTHAYQEWSGQSAEEGTWSRPRLAYEDAEGLHPGAAPAYYETRPEPASCCQPITQPVCTGNTHFVSSPNDANNCPTKGTCVNECPVITQPVCTGNTQFVNSATDLDGCPTAGTCVVVCPAVPQVNCTGNTRFVSGPNGADGCATAGSCVPIECPIVTQPICASNMHLEANPNDARGCATQGICKANACQPVTPTTCSGRTYLVPSGADSQGCPTGGACRACDADPVCSSGYVLTPAARPAAPEAAEWYDHCQPKVCVYICPPVVEPVCPAGYINFGGSSEYDSIHHTYCPTASTCVLRPAGQTTPYSECMTSGAPWASCCPLWTPGVDGNGSCPHQH